MNCPKCKSENIIKNGKDAKGQQRYKCKDCGFVFIGNKQPNAINTTTRKRNIVIDIILNKKDCSVSDIKDSIKGKTNVNTIYYWRHKVLTELLKLQEDVILSGKIQADEIYFSVNYKGNHKNSKWQMPRPARIRTADLNIRGLSKEKVAVLTAIDEQGKMIAIPVSQGRPTSNQIYDALKNHIEEGSTLITDSASSYRKTAKLLNLTLVQIPTGKHATTYNGVYYHINTLNHYHGEMRKFMSNFNGVSSKFLPEYMVWYAFKERKDLAEEQKKQILTEIMTARELKPVRQINKLKPVNINKPTRKKKTKP